ncbi:MAG TPA: hypothetical protein EYQ83_09010 [Acidobacteria bacterium]|nr:hypothetical protein [Acidobacteriota bacterium]
MTNRQHLALGVGMMCFSLMGMMPPWVHVRSDEPDTRVSAGYAFISVGRQIAPDELTEPPDGRGGRRFGRFRRTYRGVPLGLWAAEIDIQRLILQWVAVSVATGGVVWVLGRPRRPSPDAQSTPSRPQTK